MLGMLLEFLELEFFKLLAARLGGRQLVENLVGQVGVDILLGESGPLNNGSFGCIFVELEILNRVHANPR